MTILYKVHNNLYVNLTNRCTCACTFCLRQTRDKMEDSGPLWLPKEPTVPEVKEEFKKFNMEEYEEVVFCGFGEPTERLEDLLEIADHVKKTYKKPIRINTNGLANLSYGRDITPLLEGKADTLSISLNTPDSERYYQLTRSRFGPESFQGLLDFVEKAKTHVPNIVLTTVATTLTEAEEEDCRTICKNLGVQYRIRPWED